MPITSTIQGRTELLPSIALYTTAIKEAEKGNPLNLFSIISIVRGFSPRIKGNIRTRKTAVSSFGWQLVGDGKTADELAVIKNRLENVINKMIQRHHHVPLYGSVCAEIVWEYNSVQKVHEIKIVKWLHLTEIEPIPNTEGLYIVVRRGNEVSKTLADERYLYDTIQDSDGYGGEFASISLYEILADGALKEWNLLNKKLKGIIQSRYSESAANADRNTARTALADVTKNNAAYTSDAIEFIFNRLVDAGAFQSPEAFIKACKTESTIGILGQANTTELPANGGSRAALQVLQMVSADVHFDDMLRVQNWVNSTVLLWDYIKNEKKGGGDSKPSYRFEFLWNEESNTESNARTISYLVDAGFEIEPEEVEKLTGIVVKKRNDAPQT